jgi:hypothetical protein
MRQPGPTYSSTKPLGVSAWDELFMGFVIMLTLVLLVSVVGRLAMAGAVCWVYGSAGYASGIRVHFVGKTPWFTNGVRVPDAIATTSSLGAFIASVLVSYGIMFCLRYVYRLTQKGK